MTLTREPGAQDCSAGSPDYAAIFACAAIPLLLVTPEFVVVDANRAYARMVGRAPADLVGCCIFDVAPYSSEEPDVSARTSLRESLQRVLETRKADIMPVQRGDDRLPLEIPEASANWAGTRRRRRYWSPVNIPVLADDGTVQLILHRVEDVSDLLTELSETSDEAASSETLRLTALEAAPVRYARKLEEAHRRLWEAHSQLARQALRDPLTGLLMRPLFVDELGRALARQQRSGRLVAVLFLDMDRLKVVNDTYGHAAGDEVIRCCAQRLREAVRPGDPVARLGGDEFVVLLEGLTDVRDVATVAQRVLDAVTTVCEIGPALLFEITASMGVAVSDVLGGAALTPEALIAYADAAMYRAKQDGGGRWVLFDEADYTAAASRRRLESELRVALDRGELDLHFQPIVDLSTDRVDAVEALLRWRHPRLGLLSAGEFIDVAEDARLMVDLGRWVIRRAAGQVADWDRTLGDAAPRRIFVNLSIPELGQPGLAAHVAHTCAVTGVDPGRLVFEVTETGMLHDVQHVRRVLGQLHDLGCTLAIDDFGTGYSSLHRLVQLPADILKIDQSFVQNLPRDPERAAIVSAVLLLAHNMRKSVVAEGVEDAATLEILRELACPYGQGFHLARPEPGDALASRLAVLTPTS